MPLIHRIDHPIVEGARMGKTGPGGSYKINTSCIVYRLGDTLIDTGPSNQWPAVKAFLEEKTLRQVLLTHYHEDHSGNCGHIQDHFEVPLRVHENSHERIVKGFDVNLVSRMLFGDASRSKKGHKPKKHQACYELDDGIILNTVYLPGHTNDLVCIHEPNHGWLFSSDLYVSSKVRYGTDEENIKQQLASLQKAISLDFGEMFCSHQGRIKDGKKALQAKYDYLNSFKQEVEHLHSQGLSTKAITKKLLGREDTVGLSSGFKMSKHKLVKSCLK